LISVRFVNERAADAVLAASIVARAAATDVARAEFRILFMVFSPIGGSERKRV
jgi:hypothetical protein